MLDAGLCPLPQFLHTLASSGLEKRFLPLPLTGAVVPFVTGLAAVAVCDEDDFSSRSMTTGEKLLAWVILRPDLDCVGSGVMISETSESSFSSSSSRLRLAPRPQEAPARLPLGRPPRLTRPPRPRPRPDPLPPDGVPVRTDVSPSSGVSTLILGFLLPRVLVVPRLTPLIDLLGGVLYPVVISIGVGAGCSTARSCTGWGMAGVTGLPYTVVPGVGGLCLGGFGNLCESS